jgi:tRNA dimethylallyltransferase
MQMYNGLPIITNKVTVEEQKGIPHHLLGVVALDEEPWRVGLFKRHASQIIQEIRSRGHLPILVGGTHYYTQSLLFGDSLVGGERDGTDSEQSEIPLQEITRRFPILDDPPESVLQRLKEVDPIMAERWHPNEIRKIRRSLEIFLLTGKKASDIYAEQKVNKEKGHAAVEFLEADEIPQSETLAQSTLLFWVHSDPEMLRERLDARVDTMLQNGLLDEVTFLSQTLYNKKIDDVTVDRSRGIWISIGFKEFEPYVTALATGNELKKPLNELLDLSIERTKAATRQYAKRQIRWIRLKLMPALSNQKCLDNLFLLDGTNIAQWDNMVLTPAAMLTGRFLDGEQLPPPRSICDAAKQHLTIEKPDESPPYARHECDLCHTITVTEETWLAHLKSRTHRRMVKKSLQTARKGRLYPTQDVDNTSPSETP